MVAAAKEFSSSVNFDGILAGLFIVVASFETMRISIFLHAVPKCYSSFSSCSNTYKAARVTSKLITSARWSLSANPRKELQYSLTELIICSWKRRQPDPKSYPTSMEFSQMKFAGDLKFSATEDSASVLAI